MFNKLICFSLTLIAFSFTSATIASTTSQKEIKMVIQFAPGGNSDRIARVIENHIDKSKYQVRFEYRTGAGGSLAHNYLVTAKNENAFIVAGPGLVSLPVMSPDTNTYDPVRDFIAVGHLGNQTCLVVVNAASGIQNWQDLKNYAKNNNINYGSSGTGGAGHIVSALIAGNNNWVHIPYKGPALADLVSGQLTYVTEAQSLTQPLIDAKKLVPIAVSNPSRSSVYKNVPTLKELGINDHEYYRWYMLIANKSADPEVVNYMKTLLASPQLRKDLQQTQELDPVPTGLDTRAFLQTEKRKFETIAKKLNLK
jgi:tripartite-type tricarboxylate transporter receptor subunit TctC